MVHFSLLIFVFLLLGGGQVTFWGTTEGESGGTSSSSVSQWSCWKKSLLISVAARHFLNSLPLKSIIKTQFHSIRGSWPIFQKNFQGIIKKKKQYTHFFFKAIFFLVSPILTRKHIINGKFSCHHRRKTVIILWTYFQLIMHTFFSFMPAWNKNWWLHIFFSPAWNYIGMKFHVAKDVYIVCGVYRETEMNSCRHEFHAAISFHL